MTWPLPAVDGLASSPIACVIQVLQHSPIQVTDVCSKIFLKPDPTLGIPGKDVVFAAAAAAAGSARGKRGASRRSGHFESGSSSKKSRDGASSERFLRS